GSRARSRARPRQPRREIRRLLGLKGEAERLTISSSLPGLTRQSILLRKKMDARVNSAFTPVFDALCPRMTSSERSTPMAEAAVKAKAPDTATADEAQQELTDGFHLVIDGLKLNGINTIYGVPGIP